MKAYPFQIRPDNINLVIRICRLYYEKKKSQQQIADIMGVSRSQISKILIAAQDQGVVSISITDPFAEVSPIKKKLFESYDLRDALIISSRSDLPDIILSNASGAITSFISGILKDGDIIGIASGYTLFSLGNRIGYVDKTGLKVTPLLGGFFSNGATWQANTNARILAETWDCEYMQLHSPIFVTSPELKELLLDEPEINKVLKEIDKMTVGLLGIGPIDQYETRHSDGYISEDDLRVLKERGSVGGLCNFFFDADGEIVDFEGYKRMIGITPQQLMSIDTRIGIAFGDEKTDVIKAALRGRWINYLIIDENTAEKLVD